jgi:hypothetical protein
MSYLAGSSFQLPLYGSLRIEAVPGKWHLGVASAVLLASGCAGAPGACPAGLASMTRSELFFGRNIGAAEGVSDGAWRAFLDEVVTPRFPDGLTVFSSAGQWRGPDGRPVRERGFVLTVATPGGNEDRRKLEEIRSAYRTRFMQDSVLLVETRVCAGL